MKKKVYPLIIKIINTNKKMNEKKTPLNYSNFLIYPRNLTYSNASSFKEVHNFLGCTSFFWILTFGTV